jgi:hypothetical protein
LRFSDLAQITPEKFIKGGQQLKIKTQKTGEIVIMRSSICRIYTNPHPNSFPRILTSRYY